MKIREIIILSFTLLLGCSSNKLTTSREIDIVDLELWMINNSKEIKKRTTYSSFRISHPKDYYREELIHQLIDSLNIPTIQKLNINNDKFEDLLVCDKKTPYLIINGKNPKILSIERDRLREILAYSSTKNLIKIYEIDYKRDIESTRIIKEYDLRIWEDNLIETCKAPLYEINKIEYLALGYENTYYEIDMRGEIIFIDFSRETNPDISKKVWLQKGKIPKKHIEKLKNYFSIVNMKDMKPIGLGALHTNKVSLKFETSKGDFEIKDNGKRGTFSLITLYKLFDDIVSTSEFENVKEIELSELYEDGFPSSIKQFQLEN